MAQSGSDGAKQIRGYWDVVARKWLLCLFAFGLVLITSALARVFKRFSETILSLFTGNPLLRSVLGSVIAGLIVIGGVLSALHLLGMTEAVLSFLGLAGVVALAVGFAFRDIAENFIASVMLGVRRPFRVGDFIEVAGKSGVVKSLNTRATGPEKRDQPGTERRQRGDQRRGKKPHRRKGPVGMTQRVTLRALPCRGGKPTYSRRVNPATFEPTLPRLR